MEYPIVRKISSAFMFLNHHYNSFNERPVIQTWVRDSRNTSIERVCFLQITRMYTT